MPNLTHLLLGPALDWTLSRIACAARTALHATWDKQMVTCPACLQRAREPCTCGPTLPVCPTCRTWARTHRSDGSKNTGGGMTIPTEKQFQEEVRRLAAAAGWMCYHQYSSLKSPAGFPDLVLVRGPVLLAVELKMPGKAPTEAQKQWLDALRSVRQVSASVWTPDDLATILEVLR